MQGILIQYLPRNIGGIWSPDGLVPTGPAFVVPEGLTEFEFFFEPLFPEMESLYWYVDDSPSSPFMSQYDGIDDEEWIPPLRDNGVPGLYNPGILPAFANDVPNDWQLLVGIDGHIEAAADAVRQIRQQADTFSAIDKVATVFFYCVDGMQWEVFARDVSLIERVKTYLAQFAGLLVHDYSMQQLMEWAIALRSRANAVSPRKEFKDGRGAI